VRRYRASKLVLLEEREAMDEATRSEVGDDYL
jgi:hypothetical protein